MSAAGVAAARRRRGWEEVPLAGRVSRLAAASLKAREAPWLLPMARAAGTGAGRRATLDMRLWAPRRGWSEGRVQVKLLGRHPKHPIGGRWPKTHR